jgi:hypothetical protein
MVNEYFYSIGFFMIDFQKQKEKNENKKKVKLTYFT